MPTETDLVSEQEDDRNSFGACQKRKSWQIFKTAVFYDQRKEKKKNYIIIIVHVIGVLATFVLG